MHNVGLQASRTSIRTFASSPTSLLARRIPSQLPARATTAAIPLRRNPLLLTTFAVTSALTIPFLTAPTIHLDTSPVADFSSGYSHGKDAKVPLSKDGGRSLNPAAVKQISMGTILGLGLGVLVSAFSKMLVLLVGVGIVVTQVSLHPIHAHDTSWRRIPLDIEANTFF